MVGDESRSKKDSVLVGWDCGHLVGSRPNSYRTRSFLNASIALHCAHYFFRFPLLIYCVQ